MKNEQKDVFKAKWEESNVFSNTRERSLVEERTSLSGPDQDSVIDIAEWWSMRDQIKCFHGKKNPQPLILCRERRSEEENKAYQNGLQFL